MNRRTLLLALVALGAVLAAGAVALWPVPPPHDPSYRFGPVLVCRVDSILHDPRMAPHRVKMTLDEVEDIVGCPPGLYDHGRLIGPGVGPADGPPYEEAVWDDGHYSIHVLLNPDGTVRFIGGSGTLPPPPPPPTVWRRLLSELQWRMSR